MRFLALNYSNLLSTAIPDRDIKEILDAINFINEKLPELVTLTREELAALPKMGVDTINFVTENLKETQDNPAIVPKNAHRAHSFVGANGELCTFWPVDGVMSTHRAWSVPVDTS